MEISTPFIRRPIGTTLLAAALFLVGFVAYAFLPVASMPSVEFPTIRVSASRPGADPATMASSVAAPLERRLGSIAGVTEISSRSSLGSTSISIQFDLDRDIESAAQDVQAALNASTVDLPSDLPSLPSYRKFNPSASPVLILALTSDTVLPSAIYDAADSVLVQRLSQVEGVADVSVDGAEQPAIRVRVDPDRLAAMGVSPETVRAAIVAANTPSALGSFDNASQSQTIATSDQLREPEDYAGLIVHSSNGAAVRLDQVATIERGVRNSRAAGWFNGRPSVSLVITKQAEANVIATVDRVKALIPELKRWIPQGIDIIVMNDRTTTIRASVEEIQKALIIAIMLVMMVVFVFLRRVTATAAAGVTVPLSLAGTFAAMWAAGISLNNISLMALTVSVGFVVDDAIVMIENIHRKLEAGMGRMQAALEGAREIGFTVVSISLSLVAAFIPLFFMPGVVGRIFRDFSLTMTFAIAISTIVSLTVTPMICGRFMRATHETKEGWPGRTVERGISWMTHTYGRTLGGALDHPWVMLVVIIAVLGLTVQMFRVIPKGYIPQDDTGLLIGFSEGAPDVSFPAMAELQRKLTEIVQADKAVASVSSAVGGGRSVNSGRIFVSLKPENERAESSQQVINRLRQATSGLAGLRVFFGQAQDIRVGARSSNSRYQFTLFNSDFDELIDWAPRVVERLRQLPEITDVSSDRQQGGLQANVEIDRLAAARLGVSVQAINTALSNAFAQRQISTIYAARNQYRVIFESSSERQRDPSDILQLHVPGAGGQQVPLSSVATISRGIAPLVVNHEGQFPSVTISFDSAPGYQMQQSLDAVRNAVAGMRLPDTLRAEFSGEAADFNANASSQGLLILAAVLAVYIILGVLYESLIHPVTIISTLPSAALGALLALLLYGMDLTIIALIGIILLIGIVKKNGIMMVDFAIVAERSEGLSPRAAIHAASLARFRPIMMTTLAALFGALPLALATGPGAELRRPLGIAIAGGLILSQILTLYTTPAIYLLMSKLQRRKGHVPRRLKPENAAG